MLAKIRSSLPLEMLVALAVIVLSQGAALDRAFSPIDPQYAINITVFHVNPIIYGVPPINMDTADARGDMYFDMRSKALPIECKEEPDSHDCENTEVTANDLVITKLVLEVDNRYGDYGRCNVCVNGTDHHGNNSCTNGVYDCECGDFNGPPKQCGAPVGMMNLTAEMANRHCYQGSANWECWHDGVVQKTGGFWYSTTDTGYCGNGLSPAPAGCTWRVAELVKVVNKTCSDNSIYNEVERVDSKASQPCFPTCKDSGVGPMRNTTSTCWITCFYNTVLGPAAAKGGPVAGMPIQDLDAAWNAPFASNDVTKGGCPDIHKSE